jgi:hypothetical protein
MGFLNNPLERQRTKMWSLEDLPASVLEADERHGVDPKARRLSLSKAGIELPAAADSDRSGTTVQFQPQRSNRRVSLQPPQRRSVEIAERDNIILDSLSGTAADECGRQGRGPTDPPVSDRRSLSH